MEKVRSSVLVIAAMVSTAIGAAACSRQVDTPPPTGRSDVDRRHDSVPPPATVRHYHLLPPPQAGQEKSD